MPQNTKFALNAGELSDEMLGRPDIGKFQMGCEILENARVLRQGGVTRRAGFLFADMVQDQTRKSRLHGFGFSTEQGVVLEFGHLEMSVFKNGRKIAGPYVTPWTEDQVFDLQFSQRIDRIIVTHGEVPTQSLFRVTDTNWTIEEFPWSVRIWEIASTTGITVTPGARSGSTNLVASDPIFEPDWIGQRVQLQYVRGEQAFRGTPSRSGSDGTAAVYGPANISSPSLDPPADPQNDPPVTAVPATPVDGNWSFATQGNWEGTFVIERSTNNGGSYTTVDTLVSTGNQNFSIPGVEPQGSGNLIRVTYTGITQTSFDFNYTRELSPAVPGTSGSANIIVQGQPVSGNWSFETAGKWRGTYTIERSFNDGVTYDVIKTLTSNNDKNFILNEREDPDNGSLIRILYQGRSEGSYAFIIGAVDVPGEAVVTGFTSTTEVDINIERPFIEATTTGNWQEEAYSPRNGYPKTSTFFQKRLFFGGSKRRPQAIYGSRTRRPFDFTQGTNADDGLNFEIDSDGYESVLWLVSHLTLVVGTTSGVHAISSPDGRSVTAESNAVSKQVKKAGFEGIPGIHIDENVLFLQRKGRKIHELTGGSVEYGGYTSVDLTQLATQVTRNGVTQVTAGEIPDSALYVVNGDELSVLTYERPQNVVGWSRWKTEGSFESVATCPGAGEDDDVYVVVNRNGRRTVEMLSPDMLRTEEANDAFGLMFLDSAVTARDENGMTSLSGLNHLEGLKVQAFCDGELRGSYTVTNGEVSFRQSFRRVAVGLGFTTTIRPMPMDFGAIGSKSAIYDLILRFRNTYGGEVSQDGERFSNIDFSQVRREVDRPPDLQTRDVQATPHSTWKRGSSITVRQKDPLPMTLLALRLKSKTNG